MIIDVVVARYKENIDWLYNIAEIKSIKNIYIYNKSNISSPSHNKYIINTLSNIGRESNTYLHHIISNYNDLNDYTLFLQGNPFPHSPPGYHLNLENHIKQISTTIPISLYPLNRVTIEHEHNEYRYHPSHPHGLFLAYFMNLLFDIQMDTAQTVEVCYGAQFCVPKKIIHSRPKDFYIYLLKLVSRSQNSIEPYIFERLWLYIFNPNVKISNYYKEWINTN